MKVIYITVFILLSCKSIQPALVGTSARSTVYTMAQLSVKVDSQAAVIKMLLDSRVFLSPSWRKDSLGNLKVPEHIETDSITAHYVNVTGPIIPVVDTVPPIRDTIPSGLDSLQNAP